MKIKYLVAVIVLVVLTGTIIYFSRDSKVEKQELETYAKEGPFDIVVTTTGELQAENSEKITGPTALRRIRVYNVKITDLVMEGTLVDSGDYVATLDRTEAESRLKEIEANLQKLESQFIKNKLDTTLELRNARDQLINLKYTMEEMKIVLEQSKFEPPATVRQAKINLEKAERAYDQALKNYNVKVDQADTKMVESATNLSEEQRRRDELLEVLDEFIIRAPKAGMVIYAKEWNGSKRKVGASIGAWDPVVATLPDLTSMMSKTYVNEIDISKIKSGMKVNIGVDAFPGKKYSGVITEVANVGEQLPNSDAKVFEVLIKINETDSILKPSMTTSNSIQVAHFDSVVYIPLEAVHMADSTSFVFMKDGFGLVRQEVITGPSNEDEIIVEKGLSVDKPILLTKPDDWESIELKPLDR